MASLQSSCTVLATNPDHRISPLVKPSHFLPNSRRSHRFRVSCSGDVDRRNMLLGLGGLYGAANLISNPRQAYAAPIKAPDLKSRNCTKPIVKDQGNKLVSLDNEECCLLYPDTIPYYKLPQQMTSMRMRRPAHKLGSKELDKYEKAIWMMKALDEDEPDNPPGFMQQAKIHCSYCNNVYNQVGYKDGP